MLSFKSFLKEARRNPHLNPKVPINWHISQHYEDAGAIPGTDIANSFVSFTAVDKLGINPGSRYNTPIGIYAYPSWYILQKTGDYSAMRDLPFAGGQPYANVFSVKGNIINLSTMDDRQLMDLYRSMVDVFAKYAGIKSGGSEWKELADFLEEEVFDAASNISKINNPGGRFWWASMRISEMLMDPDLFYTLGYSVDDKWKAKKKPVSWNKLFREMGVDGCVDMYGDGIIHTSEPVQAVFFSKKPIKDLNRYYNKYSPADVGKAESDGERKRMLAQMSDEEYVKYVEDNVDAFVPLTDQVAKEYGEFPVPVQEKIVELHFQKGSLDGIYYENADMVSDIRPEFVAKMANQYPQHMDILTVISDLKSEMVSDQAISDFASKFSEVSSIGANVAKEFAGELSYRSPDIMARVLSVVDINAKNYGNIIRYFGDLVKKGEFDVVDTLDVARNLVERTADSVEQNVGDRTLTLSRGKVAQKVVTSLIDSSVSSQIVGYVEKELELDYGMG
jgi:hypothetical protein